MIAEEARHPADLSVSKLTDAHGEKLEYALVSRPDNLPLVQARGKSSSLCKTKRVRYVASGTDNEVGSYA